MSAAEPAHHAVSPTRLPRLLASLENRTFRMLLVGWLAAGTGYWVQLIAVNWLVLDLTDSPFVVGVVMALQLVPAVFLGLHGGVIADAFPCRWIVLLTNSAKALLAAGFALLIAGGRVEVWQVYCFAAALGVVYAVDGPARESLLTQTVRASHLGNAISLVSLAFQLGAMIGPALGGALMATLGAEYAFGLAALAYVVPAVVALLLPPATRTVRVGAGGDAGVGAGLRFAVRTPTVLWPSVIVGLFGFFMVNLPATLTTFAKEEFGTGPTGLAQLSTALAAGSFLGAVVTARRVDPLRLRTIAGSAMLLAMALLVAATAHTQPVLTLFLAAVGAAYVALLVTAQSLVQLTATSALRGRVIAAHLFIFLTGGCAGGPVLGLFTEHFGARATLLLAGAIPALVMTVIAHHLARIAQLRVGLRTVSIQIHRPTLVSRG